jgi:hypothetical protein
VKTREAVLQYSWRGTAETVLRSAEQCAAA